MFVLLVANLLQQVWNKLLRTSNKLLRSLIIASLTLRLHDTEQDIPKQYKLHNTNNTQTKYIQNVHNKYFNWIALNVIQRFNTWAEVLKRTGDIALSSIIVFDFL